MSAEELEREFAGRAVPYRGGLMLLQADDALAMVRRAEEGRVPILGVDGIIVSPQGTTAPLEHIADYPIRTPATGQLRGALSSNGVTPDWSSRSPWVSRAATVEDRRHSAAPTLSGFAGRRS
jgi:hypothetical protein